MLKYLCGGKIARLLAMECEETFRFFENISVYVPPTPRRTPENIAQAFRHLQGTVLNTFQPNQIGGLVRIPSRTSQK